VLSLTGLFIVTPRALHQASGPIPRPSWTLEHRSEGKAGEPPPIILESIVQRSAHNHGLAGARLGIILDLFAERHRRESGTAVEPQSQVVHVVQALRTGNMPGEGGTEWYRLSREYPLYHLSPHSFC
jgi:hypothetical protein